MTKICALCGTAYVPNSNNQKYCSRNCRNIQHKEYIRTWQKNNPDLIFGEIDKDKARGYTKKNCRMCGKTFYVRNARVKYYHFCSKECWYDFSRSYNVQEMHKELQLLKKNFKLSDSIIKSQQQQIDDLIEENRKLKKELSVIGNPASVQYDHVTNWQRGKL